MTINVGLIGSVSNGKTTIVASLSGKNTKTESELLESLGELIKQNKYQSYLKPHKNGRTRPGYTPFWTKSKINGIFLLDILRSKMSGKMTKHVLEKTE